MNIFYQPKNTQENLFFPSPNTPKTNSLGLTKKKSDDESYIATFKTDLGEYEINLSLKHDKLLIICNSDVEFLSIYSYSKEINLDDFKKLSIIINKIFNFILISFGCLIIKVLFLNKF